MKRQLVILSIGTAMCGGVLYGQSPAPSAADEGSRAPFGHWRMLSEDDRSALYAAADKARVDPAVRAAASRARQAIAGFNAAMIARDASIGPVLAKAEAAGGPESFRIRLTGDESEELRADREAMKGTAAEDALQRAMADYRKVVVHALIAADPSLAVVAERLPQAGLGGILSPESVAGAGGAQ